jgi:hypothetical protein
MSVLGSVPISSASSSSPERNSIRISSAPSITWLLVTMKPSSEMTKPEPSAWLRRGRLFGTLLAVEEIVEEVLERAAGGTFGAGPCTTGHDGRCRDVHDRIAHLVDQIREGRGRRLRAGLRGGKDHRDGHEKGDQRRSSAAR